MRYEFLSFFKRCGHEVICLGTSVALLLGAVAVGTTSASARLSDAHASQLRDIVAGSGFSAAMCPADWAEVHGRITGLGADGMVALLRSKAALDTPETVRAALLAFRANPSAAEFRSPRGMAELQVYHCLAEAWRLDLM